MNSSTLDSKNNFASFLKEQNELMEKAINDNVNRAFNYGWSVSIIPGIIIVIIVFFASGKNIAATFITILLILLVIMVIANIFSYITSKNTAERYFLTNVLNRLAEFKTTNKLTEEEFAGFITSSLPSDSPLLVKIMSMADTDKESREE